MKQQLHKQTNKQTKSTKKTHDLSAWKIDNEKNPEACKIKTVMEKMNRKKIMLLSEKSDEGIRFK